MESILLVALARDDDHLGQRIHGEQPGERRQTLFGVIGTGRES